VLALAVAVAAAAAAAASSAGSSSGGAQTYRWTDDKGVVHYGDSVPAEYADKERSLLNGQGVEIGHVEGRKSAAEQAKAAQAAQAARERAQHDQTLLASYGSTKEIETVRDERLAQIDGQLQASATYIDTLNTRLGALQERAMQFQPYSDLSNARRMPDDLAEDLVHTSNEVHNQRKALDAKRKEQADTRAQFDADIQRYRELTSKSRF